MSDADGGVGMIIYTEKGGGLHDAVRLAGQWLTNSPDGWQSSDDAAVQAIIDAYTVENAIAAKCLHVSILAKSLRDYVVIAISAGEMASWPIKMSEMAKFAATGSAAQCPMLSMEAAERGVTVASIVARVGGNGAVFAGLEAKIGGTDGRHRDAIKKLTTFDAVAAYDFSGGWPAVK